MPDEQATMEAARAAGRESIPGWNHGWASPKVHELATKYGAFRRIKDLFRSK